MQKAELSNLGNKAGTPKYGNKKYPQKGTYGQAVVYVQNLLNAQIQLSPLWVDGIAGPKTDFKIRQYQAARRLTVDGIVGSLTLAALEKNQPTNRKKSSKGSMVVPRIGWSV